MADCLNCGRPAPEEFCPRCGQETRERRAPFRELIGEFFDHLSLDSKLPRSLVPLLFRPGQLTEVYLAGQRASYVSPLRMYVFLSLIFFLLFSLNPPDASNFNVYVGDEAIGPVVEGRGNMQILDFDEDSFFGRRLEPIFEAKKEQFRQMDPQELIDALYLGVQGALPTALFIFLPLLALALELLFLRSGALYYDHLIFALHIQSFLFLVLSPSFLFSSVLLFVAVILLVFPLYFLLALKRVYRQRWHWTLIKFIAIMLSYLWSMGMVVMGVLVYVMQRI